MGVIFAIGGGQIAIMVTDFAQGIFCNICFLIFILFIFKLGDWDISGGYVSWEQISQSLITTPGESQINPFSSGKIDGFDFWFFLIGLVVAVYGRGAWQGSMGYAAAAKNPHERKMAGILGTWRGLAQTLIIMLIPLAVIVIMHHPSFGNLALKTQEVLAQSSDKQLQVQGLVPTALSLIMPTGLLGIFVAVMFAGMLSTDDTYMHSWGSIFIQDVIMPFRKKPFSPKQHLWALRLSVLFVAVFAWLFSYFFRQTEYVYMFFAITGAIVAGAGACLTGGLYWKRGTTLGAWVAYITSAVLATTGIILQQTWCFRDGGGLSRYLYERYHWEWLSDNLDKFPINGQWVYFICIVTGIFLYVSFSLLEHYVRHLPDFNIDKMLHRGKYDTVHEHVVENSKLSLLSRRLGITEEFTIGDKLIYWASIVWTLIWFLIFIWFTSQHFLLGGVSDVQWETLWHYKIYITLILGFVTTIWFLCGGLIDVVKLFKALNSVKLNDADDGSVVNGQNSGEEK
jgi:SSS family solute:Na+ symporter